MSQKPPRSMSTQHPDNASMPFFASNSLLGGEDEIQEAYYAFSHLGCSEQMWDCEGKEVDGYVVKKLLAKFEQFFREKQLGKELRLTLRVPNPAIEKAEAKILLETLESIPRSFDTAELFYGNEIPPIFEVILPMTGSAHDVNQIYYYYKHFVAGKASQQFFENGPTVSEWIGKFKPEKINVIPLIETKKQLLQADSIVEEYLKGKKLEEQRVFLARSDPAQNYGFIAAVLLDKLALQSLHELEEKSATTLYPIIGVGSAPFRGNLKPTNIENCLRGYPSVQTFTIQSAFKYDFEPKTIIEAVHGINETKRKKPLVVEREKALDIIERYSREYMQQVQLLEPLINRVAAFVPKRRKRKLHIGLFGYSRQVKGKALPRTITFCAALYSIGLPPELLGLNALTEKDRDFLALVYQNLENDLKDAAQFFNPNCLKIIPKQLAKKIRLDWIEAEPNAVHQAVSSEIIAKLKKGETDSIENSIARGAFERKFLG